ncbi:polyamine aminopropyltransferase [Kiloniella sp. EL199]|uniref:polyamine aminopropyltransferase n=1 Tax=Kiloniella sp. EL199 TaxID=2107581 RepID=UPI000EA3B200|nr:polyamine aminopropyltransferase [Kiloniella sp. EL199]
MSWFEEGIHPEIRQSIRRDQVLFEGKTDFQHVEIFANDLLGRVLVLDDAVQITEHDEEIYSESIAHVPLLSHPDPKSVLIIGAGDGTVLREVLKHQTVQQVTMVELDGALIQVCREHLSTLLDDAYDDPRLKLVIGDGAGYLVSGGQSYDVIIIDSTDPDENSTSLFTGSFYQNCKARLAKGGIIVAQAGCPSYQPSILNHMKNRMLSLFHYGGFYHAAIPTYVGGLHAFSWASDWVDLAQMTEQSDPGFRKAEFTTRYYSDRNHKAAFYLEPAQK